jgi:hypothetical protein
MEGASRWRVRGGRYVAREHDAVARCGGVGHRDGGQQRLRVRHEGSRYTSAAEASSTIFPRYITATRVAMCSTTERSWAMKMYVRP